MEHLAHQLRVERLAHSRTAVSRGTPRQLSMTQQLHAPDGRERLMKSGSAVLSPGTSSFRRRVSGQGLPSTAALQTAGFQPAPALSADNGGMQWKALMGMARPINFLPSVLLVLVGALTGSARPALALHSATVWVVSLAASGVSAASMMVNDYFDWRSGVDGVNSPQKPLPSGLIPPDGALLVSFSLYIAVLIAACFMARPLLRTVIALSAAVTLLYTPLLKKTTGIKNATVAAVIAASPLAGALAAADTGSLIPLKLLPLCLFVFLGIMYREVLMDITDEAGDRAAGIRTIPVVAGPNTALTVATLFIMGAGSLLGYAALHGQGLAWAWNTHAVPERLVRAAAAVSMLAVAQPVAASILSIRRHSFEKHVVSAAINASIKSLGLGMVLLAAAI